MALSRADYAVIGISLTVALTLGLIITSYDNYQDCKMRGKQPQYWGEAPNGEYEVLCYEENETSVYFPLCPSYGGQLHGEYKILEELLPLENGWALVTLENNIITEVNYLGT